MFQRYSMKMVTAIKICQTNNQKYELKLNNKNKTKNKIFCQICLKTDD